MKSYGCLQPVMGNDAVAVLPPAHVDFYRALETMHVNETALCVHAGLNPLRPLNGQFEEELLWIRQEFIFHPHTFPHTVVFGHTPHRDVLFDLPYKIGIDTGLVYGGKLSCLELTERKLFQIARGSLHVNMTDVTNRW